MKDPSPFWTFSLTVYSDSAVQEECLCLQDHHGIDVNLLLFCAFVGAVHGAVLSPDDVRQAAGIVEAWHSSVVASLRAARRALKPFAAEPSPITSKAEALRTDVKAVELEAERLEQMMLQGWGAAQLDRWPRSPPAQAVAHNLLALFAIGGGSARELEPPRHLVTAALAAAGQRPG